MRGRVKLVRSGTDTVAFSRWQSGVSTREAEHWWLARLQSPVVWAKRTSLSSLRLLWRRGYGPVRPNNDRGRHRSSKGARATRWKINNAFNNLPIELGEGSLLTTQLPSSRRTST